MSWWKKLRGATRSTVVSLENPSVPLSRWMESFESGPGFAGVSVTPRSLMQLPAAAACIRLIADTMATISLNVVDDDSNEMPAAPLWKILHDAVNPETSSVQWRRQMFRDILAEHGDHFSRLEWNGANRLKAIWRLDPARMSVEISGGRRLYRYRLLDGGEEIYRSEDILHLMFEPDSTGMRSRRPVDVLKEAAGLGLAMQSYGARFFESGGLPSVIVSQLGMAGPEAKQRAATSIASKLKATIGKAAGVLVLDGGQKADVVSTDPRNGQFLESRNQQVEEIARIYGVPPALIGHYAGGLPKSIDFLVALFVKTAIRPWCEIVEGEIALKIVGDGRRVMFDLSDLERGDFKQRVEAVSRGVQSSIFTPNDGRRFFRLPRSSQAGADDLYLQQNMANVSALPGAEGATNDNSDPAIEPDGDEA